MEYRLTIWILNDLKQDTGKIEKYYESETAAREDLGLYFKNHSDTSVSWKIEHIIAIASGERKAS